MIKKKIVYLLLSNYRKEQCHKASKSPSITNKVFYCIYYLPLITRHLQGKLCIIRDPNHTNMHLTFAVLILSSFIHKQ